MTSNVSADATTPADEGQDSASPNSNVAGLLAATAAASPTTVAIKLDDLELTYGELGALASRMAGLLRSKGIEPGDRVALMAPNIPQMPVAYYGILWAGAIVVPMNPLLKSREIDFYLSNSGAKFMIAWEGVLGEAGKSAEDAGVELMVMDNESFLAAVKAGDAVAEPAAFRDSDTAVVLYTSGTTGRPKGAELSQRNLLSNARLSVELWSLESGAQDVIFGGLPFFHVFGQTCVLNAGVLSASTITLLPRFEPKKAHEIIKRDRVTILAGVPTMYVALLRSSDQLPPESVDLSTVRLAVSGGSALPVEVLHEFERRFEVTLLEGYGLSETSPVISFNQLDGVRKAGSIGTPAGDIQLRVVDLDGSDVPQGEVGEILAKGEAVMKGYWRDPEATASVMTDGWFHTGDLARVDEDGVFFIVDRTKDMILRGGYNVYPREVEEVFYEHPAVAEAAVVGRPDVEHGEEIFAVVALKQGAEATEDELRTFVKERVAAYKYPRTIQFVTELPKGPTGKILKRELR